MTPSLRRGCKIQCQVFPDAQVFEVRAVLAAHEIKLQMACVACFLQVRNIFPAQKALIVRDDFRTQVFRFVTEEKTRLASAASVRCGGCGLSPTSPWQGERRDLLPTARFAPGEAAAGDVTVFRLPGAIGQREGCDSKRCRVGSVWIDLAGGLG